MANSERGRRWENSRSFLLDKFLVFANYCENCVEKTEDPQSFLARIEGTVISVTCKHHVEQIYCISDEKNESFWFGKIGVL